MTFGMAVAPSVFLEVDSHLHTSTTHLDTNTTHNRAMGATLSRLPPRIERRARFIKSKLRRTPKPVPAVVTHALSIVEILEAILFEVDHRTLLVACQRVSRSWKVTIGHSHLLQQWLFFRPARMLQACDHYDDGRCLFLINPLLQWGFPGWFECKYTLGSDGGSHRVPVTTEGRFNAMLWTTNSDAWRRKEASWRRMEVTQPPTRRLEVGIKLPLQISYLLFSNSATPFTFPQHDGNGNGLLMGSLYDYVMEMAFRREFVCSEILVPKTRGNNVGSNSVHIRFPHANSDSNEEWMELEIEREFWSNFGWVHPMFESEAREVLLEAPLHLTRWTMNDTRYVCDSNFGMLAC
jgi:hypothetical protein